MKILIACEYSGRVREAFRKLGHDAWSCDILPSDDNSPYHIQDDVLKHLDKGWDLMIAHPPCTYLSNSGVTWLARQPGRQALMIKGAEFFKALLNAPIPVVAIENPIMHKYAVEIIGRRQDQVVQPWMFGHLERKATCLWLRGLSKLTATNDVKEEMLKLPKNVQQRLHYLPPSKDRWKLRSTTYQGIADAMADQWGNTPEDTALRDAVLGILIEEYKQDCNYDALVRLVNLITLHTQKAEIQTIMNLSAQWVQERITHCLDTPAEEWKTELDHYDEFVSKFIAHLTNPTKGEL